MPIYRRPPHAGVPPLGPYINQQHPLNRSRLGWWLAVPPLDGGGTLWNLRNQYPGTLVSASWSSGVGRPARALTFDGSTSHVDMPGTWSIPSGDTTLAIWARSTALTGATALSIASTASNNPMWGLLGPNASGFWGMLWRDDVAAGPGTVAGTTNKADGLWHHVAAVKSGTGITLYVDGLQEATGSGASGTITTTNLTLGCWRRTTNVSFFNGSIVDSSVWNRALSASEIRELFEEGLAGYPDTLYRPRSIRLFIASSIPSSSGAAMLTGTGSLSVSGVASNLGAVTMAGTGHFTVTGTTSPTSAYFTAQPWSGEWFSGRWFSRQPSTDASAVLPGTGGLSVAGVADYAAAVTFAGSGSLSVAGVASYTAAATLAGTGGLSVDGVAVPPGFGAVTMAGLGGLSASGVVSYAGAATLAGTGSLSVAGVASYSRSAVLPGVGGLSASGSVSYAAAAALAGTGALSVTGVASYAGAATLSGTGGLTASGASVPAGTGSAIMAGRGGLSASGYPSLFGAATMAGTGGLSVSGVVSYAGAATLAGTGSLSAAGTSLAAGLGAATLDGVGGLSVSGVASYAGAARLAGVGGLTAVPVASYTAMVVMAGTGGLSVQILPLHYPDPFAATDSASPNPFAAISTGTPNPFAATSQLF